MEGHLRDGDAVVVLDDTVTTGASTLLAIDAVRETCPTARIVHVMSVVDRQEGGREKIEAAGWVFDALVTRDDLFRLYEGR
jgi:orotate phosphoribosyltransferase